ncbi:hypothetical protein [Frankia sp. R82]|uniref:hypothetical protein n=1 Tax=Frankia sp. R82 TaxID=2950553 RepID=UPI00204357C7|nr:hypothetical protein [Frankia sp. R82]MCM3885760.1 hypothetical protein [Frankia sp. R82]
MRRVGAGAWNTVLGGPGCGGGIGGNAGGVVAVADAVGGDDGSAEVDDAGPLPLAAAAGSPDRDWAPPR